MENEKKGKQIPLVNEAFLMEAMAKGTGKASEGEAPKVPEEEKPVAREKPRQKRASDMNYGQQFLSSHTMTRRGEKSIYIRQEHHERLSRIVQVIGEDKIPLYAYLDNIIEHHFEQFEKAITEDFNNKYKPIF